MQKSRGIVYRYLVRREFKKLIRMHLKRAEYHHREAAPHYLMLMHEHDLTHDHEKYMTFKALFLSAQKAFRHHMEKAGHYQTLVNRTYTRKKAYEYF